MKYCSNVAQSAKKCLRVLKMQNSAPNSKKCSKGAQRNRERPTRLKAAYRGEGRDGDKRVLFHLLFCVAGPRKNGRARKVSLSRARSFLDPLLPRACYALLRRLSSLPNPTSFPGHFSLGLDEVVLNPLSLPYCFPRRPPAPREWDSAYERGGDARQKF